MARGALQERDTYPPINALVSEADTDKKISEREMYGVNQGLLPVQEISAAGITEIVRAQGDQQRLNTHTRCSEPLLLVFEAIERYNRMYLIV